MEHILAGMTADSALSPRHARFVTEFLRDGNATRAYVRAGYSPRGAQPSSARLMGRPDIAAAIAAGRQRLGRAAEVTLERVAQEYARIAFASVDDFMTVDAEGKLRVDLAKASAVQRAAIVEIKVRTNSKQEQEVTLKLGKMQALAALTKQADVLMAVPEPGLTAGDRERADQRCAQLQRALNHSIQVQRRLEQQLREATATDHREALRCAQDDRGEASSDGDAPGSRCPTRAGNPPAPRHPARSEGPGGDGAGTSRDGDETLPSPASDPQYARSLPLRETTAPPNHVPGLYPDTRFVWSGGRALSTEIDSAEALRRAPRGGFPGW